MLRARFPFPYATMRLACAMPGPEVAAALRAVTDPKLHYTLFDPYLGDFRGRVSEDGFQVRWQPYGMWREPLITSMTFFIDGAIRPAAEGCIIDVTVRRDSVIFWLPAALTLASVAIGLSPPWRPQNHAFVATIPMLFFGLTWLLGMINLKVGLGQLRTRLSQLWRTRTIKPAGG